MGCLISMSVCSNKDIQKNLSNSILSPEITLSFSFAISTFVLNLSPFVQYPLQQKKTLILSGINGPFV
jgi:hypothetical protein